MGDRTPTFREDAIPASSRVDKTYKGFNIRLGPSTWRWVYWVTAKFRYSFTHWSTHVEEERNPNIEFDLLKKEGYL